MLQIQKGPEWLNELGRWILTALKIHLLYKSIVKTHHYF